MQLTQLSPGKIRANETMNSRIDYGDIQELADSIRESGLQQPLTVVPDSDGNYRVVDGFRRMRAISLLSKSGQAPGEIPVLIRELSETDSLYLQCTGNQGKQLTPLEFGELCRRLEAKGETLSEISRKTGKSTNYINDCIGLSYAPEAIQEAVKSGQISGTRAIKLMKETDPETLEDLIIQANEVLDKPAKIKIETPAKPEKQTTGKSTGTGKAEQVLTELYQLTGNDKLILLMECLAGNIPVSSLVTEFKTL